MRKITKLFALFLLISNFSFGQTTLAAGDIAFIGYNLDGLDHYAFILLKEVDAATTITFTDAGWTGSAFFVDPAGGEGTWTWTAGATRTCGTVVTIGANNGFTASIGTVTGTNAVFSLLGDQIIAYQGSSTSPTIIAAIHSNIVSGVTNDTNWDGGATSNQNSALPSGLTNGVNAIRLHASETEVDNWRYKGTVTSGTAAVVRAAINNVANWDSNNDTEFSPTAPAVSWSITCPTANAAPTDIALSATTINENVAVNSVVGALSSTDANSGDTFTYSLVSGTGSVDNTLFAINGANLNILESPNFEAKGAYFIRIKTTDQGGLFFEKQFMISVNNVNESPTDLMLSASAVDENVATNSTVGTLSSTDPDASNTFSYTLVSGTGDDDNTSFSISGSDLKITNSPDFETKSSYSIRVRTTDQGSLTFEKQFTITINNINDVLPVITSITTDSGDSSTDYITSDNKPTVFGTAEPGALIVLIVNGNSSVFVGETVTADGSGTFSFPFPAAFGTLADAVANIQVTSSLGGTTLSSANRPVTIDTAAGMSFTTPIAGDNIIDNIEAINLTLSGTSTSVEEGRGVTITISDGANPNVVATTTIDAAGAWTKSGIDLSSLNDGALTITVNVTDLAGNTGIGNENGVTLNKSTLSTNDFSASKNAITIYPNPVTSILTVVNSENSTVESIEVIASNGQVVATAKNNTRIDVSNLVSGVYLVKINSGNKIEIKKIIKK